MARVKKLKDGDSIPDSDNVVRYCSPRHVDNGKIQESAFELKSKEKGLSVNWLEYFNGNMDFPQRLQAIRDSIALSIKPAGRFAKISVRAAKQTIRGLLITYHPDWDRHNPSHAHIRLPDKDENRSHTLELAHLVGPNDIFPAVPE